VAGRNARDRRHALRLRPALIVALALPVASLLCPVAIPPVTAAVGPVITATKTLDKVNGGTPGASVKPGDTLTYKVVISNTGLGDATGVTFNDTPDSHTTITGTTGVSPIAFDDSYSAIGNVGITVPAASGVLANDYMGQGSTATITASDTTSANGGTVSVASDGSFTYEPKAGFTGADTFTYTLSNSTGSSVGTVTVSVSNMIWFINNAASAGTGTLASPFNSLAAFQAVNDGIGGHPGANATIFLYTGTAPYTSPITLLNGQKLVGQGASQSLATISGISVPTYSNPLPTTGGTAPTIGASSRTTVTLGSGNTLSGVALSSTGGTALAGASVGSFKARDDTVSNTAGTAVNLSNGALDVIFRSVSANGGAHGIALTSTTGSFDVEGDGQSDPTNTTRGRTTAKNGGGTLTLGSGGTIQSATGAGVVLSSATNVTLRNTVIQNNGSGVKTGFDGITATNGSALTLDNTVISGQSGNNGLHATGLSGLTFEHCEVHDNATNSGVAGGTEAWNVRLDEVTGTVAVANSKLSNSYARVMGTQNHNSTSMTLTVTNSLFDGGAAINNGSALLAEAYDSASLTLSFTGSTANNGRNGEGVDANYNNSSTGSFTVKNSSFDNNGVDNGGGADINVASTKGNVTFDIENNTTRANTTVPAGGNAGTSIGADLAGTANAASVLQGKILNNTVGNAAVAESASTAGAGIAVQGNAGIMTVNISNNTVNQSGSEGIAIIASGVSAALTATINATVTGNSAMVSNNVNAADGLGIAAGGGGFPDTVCANVSGNVKFDASNNVNAIGGVNAEVLGGATMSLQGYGGAANNSSQIITFLNGTATTVNPTSNVLITAGSTIKAAPSNCATPPLLLARGGVAARQHAHGASPSGGGQVASPASATSHRWASLMLPAPLTQQELALIVAAAIERWAATGLTPAQLALLRHTHFTITHLGGWYLGKASPSHVTLDATAAGDGWYSDASPQSTRMFRHVAAATRFSTDPSSPAAGHIDLLTTVMHEMGHVLGLGDLYAPQDRNDLMYGYVTMGERRFPRLGEAAGAIPSSQSGHPDFALTPVSIGTLPKGKSVTITFNVTVNDPPNLDAADLAGGAHVSNTGSVSGSNFTTVTTNTLNTPVQLYATTTHIGSSPNPSKEGQQVTFTATVAKGAGVTTSAVISGTVEFKDGSTDISGCSSQTITSGQATCSTAALTASASPHTITAIYSGDGNFATSQDSLSQTVIPPPDLTLTKSHTAGSFTQGLTGTYTITVHNSGGGPTDGTSAITVTDTLPTGLSVKSISGTGWTCTTTPTLGCSRTDPSVTLAAGSDYPAITLTVNIAPDAPTSVINQADVSGGGELNTSNDHASDVTPIASGSNLTVTKTADAATVDAGSDIGFAIVVKNTGTGVAANATLADPLPGGPSGSGVSWSIQSQPSGNPCSITGSVGSQSLACTFGNVNPGVTLDTIHLTSPTSFASCGTYANTASVAADNNPSTSAGGTASTVVQCPALTVTKAADALTPSAGETIGFVITVTNASTAGTGTAKGVSLSDTLPGGTDVSWSIASQPSGNPCSISGTPPNQTLSCSSLGISPPVLRRASTSRAAPRTPAAAATPIPRPPRRRTSPRPAARARSPCSVRLSR
jgi:uncharacterized repeat protein (TIGR01451 family)